MVGMFSRVSYPVTPAIIPVFATIFTTASAFGNSQPQLPDAVGVWYTLPSSSPMKRRQLVTSA